MEKLIPIIRAIVNHAQEDWPAALFVTAIVTVVHLHFGWFDPVDRFAYIVLAHLSSRDVEEVPTLVLLAIDEVTQATRYLDRSPLDRCVLKEHISQIYKAEPLLVVMDLDISPAFWLHQKTKKEGKIQKKCEDGLYKLIKRNGKKTVLMSPFAVPKQDIKALKQQSERQEDWVKDMRANAVQFGKSELLIEGGIVSKTAMSPDSLSRVALCRTGEIDKYRKHVGSEGSANKVILEVCNDAKLRAKPIILNFRKAIHSVDLREFEVSSPGKTHSLLHDKVVFFGGRYGEQDRFLTLRDEMYGVDVHALGYASAVEGKGIDFLDEHGGHIFKLAVDLTVAFLMGTLITALWRQYFKAHESTSRLSQQSAFLHLCLLGLCFVVALFLCAQGSLLLLMHAGIWVSPVPIVIGLLIESFASSSVSEALRKNPLISAGNSSLHHTTSLKEFFVSSWWNDLVGSELFVALMVVVRLLLWVAVVIWCLFLVFFKES